MSAPHVCPTCSRPHGRAPRHCARGASCAAAVLARGERVGAILQPDDVGASCAACRELRRDPAPAIAAAQRRAVLAQRGADRLAKGPR